MDRASKCALVGMAIFATMSCLFINPILLGLWWVASGWTFVVNAGKWWRNWTLATLELQLEAFQSKCPIKQEHRVGCSCSLTCGTEAGCKPQTSNPQSCWAQLNWLLWWAFRLRTQLLMCLLLLVCKRNSSCGIVEVWGVFFALPCFWPPFHFLPTARSPIHNRPLLHPRLINRTSTSYSLISALTGLQWLLSSYKFNLFNYGAVSTQHRTKKFSLIELLLLNYWASIDTVDKWAWAAIDWSTYWLCMTMWSISAHRLVACS